jgi:hypothetical protein
MISAAGRPRIWQLAPPEARQAFLTLAQLTDAQDVPIGKVENEQ